MARSLRELQMVVERMISNTKGKVILRLLTEDRERSHLSIAQEVGVSREYVRVVAKTIGDTGRARQKLRAVRQAADTRSAVQQEVPPEGALRRVWDAAKEARLPVERVPIASYGGRRPWFHLLRITGRSVAVARAFNGFLPGRLAHPGYARFRVPDRDVDFFTLVICAPGYPTRIFVIPAALLTRGSMVYIPLEQRRIYRNRPPRIPWWDYEDAWRLLKQEKH